MILALPKERFPDEEHARGLETTGLLGVLRRLIRRPPKVTRHALALVVVEVDGRRLVDLVSPPGAPSPMWFEPLIAGPPAMGRGGMPVVRGGGYREAAGASQEGSEWGVESLVGPVRRHLDALPDGDVRACAWPFLTVGDLTGAPRHWVIRDWHGDTYVGSFYACEALGMDDPAKVVTAAVADALEDLFGD